MNFSLCTPILQEIYTGQKCIFWGYRSIKTPLQLLVGYYNGKYAVDRGLVHCKPYINLMKNQTIAYICITV